MANFITRDDIVKINDNLFEVPKAFRSDMRVPARVYVNEQLLEKVLADRSLWQIVNVATLPGIQKYAIAMPDMHEGYGFPIGGVAAMAIDEGGVISPGGIGYDINCGVRLLASQIDAHDAQSKITKLAQQIFRDVPSGVGRSGETPLSPANLDRVLKHGAKRMVEMGIGNESDLEHCEERGSFVGADPSKVSKHAKDRGRDQLGTLGSGNHFMELQIVDEIFDDDTAKVFGLWQGQLTAMVHCGSRGLGHQVCTDYVRIMLNSSEKWNFSLIDRQLACAPFESEEGQDYFAAMKASANFAWANRHAIGHQIRAAFEKTFGKDTLLHTVYDVAHNIGKIEKHLIDGKLKELIVHRKGATRSFGVGRSEIPMEYREFGQPVLIPGTMGTASYVMAGTAQSLDSVFGSASHGAGRAMSRAEAKRRESGSDVRKGLHEQGIVVCSDSNRGLAEEAPYAYKDIEEVIDVTAQSGLAKKVARLRPLAVIKGD